jgi:feruloyl esterase
MTTFKARGGKLLIYQGVSDPVFSASDIGRWDEQVQQDTDGGDAAQTRQWARLFMVPGMTHCSDGPALNEFDPLAAIENWVEQKHAPDAMPATGRNYPGKTQPLCPYPQYAKYVGGNVDDVRSYSCTAAR